MRAVKANITRPLNAGARVLCSDNSGAKIIEIISVLKLHGVRRRYPKAGIGDIIVGSVKKGNPETRKQKVNAIIIRQKKEFRRPDGVRVKFEDNACVLTTETGEPKGSEIRGPVAREAAERWDKIASVASIIV